ncbi:MAG: ankyrin repeat domain-containing protein [Burkholderiales bacterium]|nr:ankyrin repeat domain-containing protein [Burkholderiales bacterium]
MRKDILAIVLIALGILASCAPERDLNTQLVVAARGNDIKKVESLLTQGALVNGKEKTQGEGQTALFHAAAEGHIEIVALLILRGADVNEHPPGRSTALMMAAYGGFDRVVEILINAGANINARNDNGWTALHNASRQGHLNVVKLLIAGGAEANLPLPDGNTPKSLAERSGHHAVVQYLDSLEINNK